VPTFKDLPRELVRLHARYGLAKRWRKHYEDKLSRAAAKEAAALAELNQALGRDRQEAASA